MSGLYFLPFFLYYCFIIFCLEYQLHTRYYQLPLSVHLVNVRAIQTYKFRA